MIPKMLVIKSPKGIRRFVVASRRFSIGSRPEDDLLVCHGFFRKCSLLIHCGQITEIPADDTGGCADPHMRHGSRFEAPGLLVEVRRVPWRRGLILAILASALITAILTRGAHTDSRQDWTPISLPAEGPFGFCRQDRTHPEGVRLTLGTDPGSKSSLTFTPGGTGAGLELQVTVDGNPERSSVPVPKGWGKPVRVTLAGPAKTGKTSVLEIRPAQSSGKPAPWGVKDLKLVDNRLEIKDGDAGLDLAYLDSMLSDPLSDGPSLSRCYRVLASRREQDKTISEDRCRTLQREFAARIILIIRKDLMRIRSLADLGRDEEARVLRRELESWVPEREWLTLDVPVGAMGGANG